MGVIDFKKTDKLLYFPKEAPLLIEVPAMSFIMIDGCGDPADDGYQQAVSCLYGLAYTIKMKFKQLLGYQDYRVYPLESLWWSENGVFDPDNRTSWKWTAMIRQPDFVTISWFDQALDIYGKKNPDSADCLARFERFEEGLSVQAMHHGSFRTEPETIEKIKKFIAQNALVDRTEIDRHHHEIYLSDPNRSTEKKLKTVIRYPVTIKNSSF